MSSSFHTRRRKPPFFNERGNHIRNIRDARATNVARFVEFYKENFTRGEYSFKTFIFYLISPIVSVQGDYFSEFDSPPSFLTNIMNEFFELLKNTPELPHIGVLFTRIIEVFSLPSHGAFNKEVYIEQCNVLVDNFISDISDKKLKIDDDVAKNIKLFFTNVASILSDFIYERKLQIIPEARIAVGVRMNHILPILEGLIDIINKNKPYHKIIQGFTIYDLIQYGNTEREHDISEIKKRSRKYYLDEYTINQGLDELAEERQQEREIRRIQRTYAPEGGRRRMLKMRSIKKHSSSYKHYSYRNKNNKNKNNKNNKNNKK
jgi:hypothetical protein